MGLLRMDRNLSPRRSQYEIYANAQSFNSFSLTQVSVPGPTPGAGLLSLAFLVLAGAMTKARASRA